MERTISFMNGEGSIGHNTRRFIADNVDASRTKNNITLIHEDIKQAYHKLFDKALKEYNVKQKRKDRQIKSYYDKISRSKQEKLFYEVIVQIGNRDDTIAENQKLQLETTDLRLKNSELRLEYYENVDKLTDKQKEIEVAQKEADKWMMISDTAKLQTERAEFELEEAERLKKELLGVVDGDDYLKEQVIELRYQNQILREENRSLKDKLEKAYEFMKQFVIGGINLLEKFMEWIGEKGKDVGRGR